MAKSRPASSARSSSSTKAAIASDTSPRPLSAPAAPFASTSHSPEFILEARLAAAMLAAGLRGEGQAHFRPTMVDTLMSIAVIQGILARCGITHVTNQRHRETDLVILHW